MVDRYVTKPCGKCGGMMHGVPSRLELCSECDYYSGRPLPNAHLDLAWLLLGLLAIALAAAVITGLARD